MKKLKKESTVWIIIVIVLALFILFMPGVEQVLYGRKHYSNNKPANKKPSNAGVSGAIHKVNYPKSTNCSLEMTLDTGDKDLKNVVFNYSTSGTVSKITMVDKYTYLDLERYKVAANRKVANKIGVTEKISSNETDKTVTVKSTMIISDMQELTEYPSGYAELKAYLTKKGYNCTESK